MEFFYKLRHPEYKTLPPVLQGCPEDKNVPAMEFIYPTQGVKIFIPRDETGKPTRIIAEVAHRNPSKKIYWHLDKSYLTTTRFIHQTEFFTGPGPHQLTAVDEDGNSIKCSFGITGAIESSGKN